MKHHETLEHASFDAPILALDVETSALDEETSVLDAETSALGAAIARSYRRYWRRVFGDIGNCGVGITLQMCNRVTNHGDMGIFSRPVNMLDGLFFMTFIIIMNKHCKPITLFAALFGRISTDSTHNFR